MTEFTTRYKRDTDIVKILQQTIKKEVCNIYQNVEIEESFDLMDTLFAVADQTKERFVMIIDEWDAICREFDDMPAVMDEYVNLLRRMFKGARTSQVFMGVYMTGILPIKKYNTQSALNNFREYSMIRPGVMSQYLGFTHDEVEALCRKHGMDLSEMERWYDGYTIGKQGRMFNPYSVMNAVEDTSWSELTEVLQNSRDLLDATLRCDEEAVAKAINMVHSQNTSILTYNNENSLACVLAIAYEQK